MADNPKSLASLAGELEHGLTPAEMERVCRYVASKGWQGNLPFMRATLAAIEDAGFAVVPREAAAALRVPTIARPVTDEMVEACAKSLLTSSADAYHAWLSRTDSAWVVLRAALKAALATPSPTIAAPSPSNEVTPEMVEAFCAEYWEDLPTDLCGQDTRKEIHRCLKAALKARKPAEDGVA